MIYSFFQNLVPKRTCVKCRRNGDFLIVMNVKNELHYLNNTAAFIYDKVDGKANISQILDSVFSEYEISEEEKNVVTEDLLTIIRDFQWQNLIKLTEEKKNEKI